MGRPSRFSPEVRERAVRMVEEHRVTTRRSGACCSRWRRSLAVRPRRCGSGYARHSVTPAIRPGLTTSERERLKELEREVRELKRANEILRKASAYFAQAELDRRGK